jgi:hypothetical protein
VGHFVFAKLLLPSVKAAAKTGVPDATRIVWTSSNGHNMAPKGFVNWDDVNLTKFTGFSQGWTKYGQSKAVQFPHSVSVQPKLTFEREMSFSQIGWRIISPTMASCLFR